jgi:serine protease Do
MQLRPWLRRPVLAAAALLFLALPARSNDSFADVADKVNAKLVKIFGSGGFKGLVSYGSGALVSADGYVLTVATPMLDSQDVRVHMADGRRYHAKVIVVEPQLDVALLKIEGVKDLEYFDIAQAAQKPVAETGTGILAFSNQFRIAEREEAMSVQQGRISAYNKLPLRRGLNEAPYQGRVYVVDAITNNPGAGGGVITTRKGELLGIVGKELRNNLTETWINYAIPINATAPGKRKGADVTVSIAEVVEKGKDYVPTEKPPKLAGPGGFHGIILVPNVVERTPPYVEEVVPNSPAARAGLKPDDLIVYIDGEQIGSIAVFKEIVDHAPPDTEFKIEVRRGDKLETVKIKLEKPRIKK